MGFKVSLWENKVILDPFLDEKEEDIKRLKNIQLELHEEFINVVEEAEVKIKKIVELNYFLVNFGQEKI